MIYDFRIATHPERVFGSLYRCVFGVSPSHVGPLRFQGFPPGSAVELVTKPASIITAPTLDGQHFIYRLGAERLIRDKLGKIPEYFIKIISDDQLLRVLDANPRSH